MPNRKSVKKYISVAVAVILTLPLSACFEPLESQVERPAVGKNVTSKASDLNDDSTSYLSKDSDSTKVAAGTLKESTQESDQSQEDTGLEAKTETDRVADTDGTVDELFLLPDGEEPYYQKHYNADGSYYIYDGWLSRNVLIENNTPDDNDYSTDTDARIKAMDKLIAFPLCGETSMTVYDAKGDCYLEQSDLVLLPLNAYFFNPNTAEKWEENGYDILSVMADECSFTDITYNCLIYTNEETGITDKMTATSSDGSEAYVIYMNNEY